MRPAKIPPPSEDLVGERECVTCELVVRLKAARKCIEAADRLLGAMVQRQCLENGGRYLLSESEAAAADVHTAARAEFAKVEGAGTVDGGESER